MPLRLWCLTSLSIISQLLITWRSVLFVEENGVPGGNHRPAANHLQTLSHNVALHTIEAITLTIKSPMRLCIHICILLIHVYNTNATFTHFLFPLVCYIEALLIGVTALL